MKTLAGEKLLDEDEAAEILGVTVSTLRSNAARRKGPPRISAHRKIYYREGALLDWLKGHEVAPEAARGARA